MPSVFCLLSSMFVVVKNRVEIICRSNVVEDHQFIHKKKESSRKSEQQIKLQLKKAKRRNQCVVDEVIRRDVVLRCPVVQGLGNEEEGRREEARFLEWKWLSRLFLHKVNCQDSRLYCHSSVLDYIEIDDS